MTGRGGPRDGDGPGPQPGPPPSPAPAGRLARFDAWERWVHWITAALLLVLMATGAALYVGSLSALVGRRGLVRAVHVVAGLALPLPFLVVWAAGRRGVALRSDLTRLNRWSVDDWRWLRPGRRAGTPPSLGKFNPGQKLNAAFTAGAVVVMLGTGIVMRWFGPFPLSWRTGATSVHDLVATALVVVVAGHVALAVTHREALRAMVRGWVTPEWARRHAPAWYAEVRGGAGAELGTLAPMAVPAARSGPEPGPARRGPPLPRHRGNGGGAGRPSPGGS